MTRNLRHYTLIALKGFAMGAANVVPGVSGGTIALITGIFDELMEAVKSINAANLKLFFKGHFKEFWQGIHGNFLLALFVGLVVSIFSLAKVLKWLLGIYPILVWAFFFGLIIASLWILGKEIIGSRPENGWNVKTGSAAVIALAVGVVGGYLLGLERSAQTPDTWWFVLLCGAVAMCTMILPGISGSLVLMLMGKYEYIMVDAVADLNLPVLGIFAVGAVAGLSVFSHLLSFLLKRFRAVTLSLLTGMVAGSLRVIWPWKDELNRVIAPNAYIWQAALLMLAGMALVFALEKFSAPEKA